MMAKLLTGASKLFTLLAVACGVLGLFSMNWAKADLPGGDPPPSSCNCGTPPTSTGPAWDAFVSCYDSNCANCKMTCFSAVPPGSPGHADWLACYNNCRLSRICPNGSCGGTTNTQCAINNGNQAGCLDLCCTAGTNSCDCKYSIDKCNCP